MAKIAIVLLKFYQKTLSPDHSWLRHLFPGGYCRFQPTCSSYAIMALEEHGVLRGGYLAFRRVLKCRPWGKCHGFDPVPNKNLYLK